MKNPPIFYINLDKDISRRQLIEKSLNAAHLNAERISGVWWKLLSDENKNRLYQKSLNLSLYYKPLVDGEKGCYASHIEAWKRLLASDAEYAVILEDDVSLSPCFTKVLMAIENVPQEWDMIKLMGRSKEKIHHSTPLIAEHSLIAYRKIPSYTAGYLISRSGAENLLRSRIPFGRPIDIDLRFWWENSMRIFGIYPAIVLLNETSEQTSIAGRHTKSTLSTKFRKFMMKLSLAIGSWLHTTPPLPIKKN